MSSKRKELSQETFESGSSEDERRPKRRRVRNEDSVITESSTFVLKEKVLDVTLIDSDKAITQNDGCNNSILLIVDNLHLYSPLPIKRKNNVSGECTNCKTDKSPIWRKGPNSAKLCNKCGLYWKRYSKQRPLELDNDIHSNLMLLIAAVQQMQEPIQGL